MEHQEQIINRDNIIRERTERLISIQERLIEEERASIGKKLQAISMELVTTEERERRAIATDLHDSVTQLLALSLSRIKSVQRRKPEMGELHDIRTHLEQALTDLRSLTFQISPPVLYDFGLEAALEWLVTDINIRHDMCLVFSNLLSRPLAPDQQAKVTLYRVVRELVINVVKHVRTREGQIILREDGDLFVAEVADEGKGFDIAQVSGNGFGLFSLKDRLLYLGGDLTIDTQPGEGTVVQIIIPLSNLSSCGDVKLCPEVSLQQHPQLKVSSC
ncbi:Histidine kinase [Desulfopila aestuarii DSM 18488]|uniref:Oxygen sensor histidine kinase NreB n=2 Tax=Desulfopila aestuarii TaxID=231440 RepID=A0A1M7YAF5_9BACT|nr:Histidine kinase [Desulfopila aestuarii DSM 18488]